MITSPVFAGKRYAILGLARSGMATLDALHASGAELLAWDNQVHLRNEAEDKADIGDLLEADLSGFDAIIVSPGVPLNNHPISQKAKDSNVPIIGDIELFAQARSTLPPHRVVGITGTNGKSTTTALLHHIFQSTARPSLMGGNIGIPIMAQKPLTAGGVYVLELSSYQIDLTHTLDCDVAILLNITPDHLDRYDSFDAYAASKARLFDMLSPKHTAIISGTDDKCQLIIKYLREENRIGDVVDLSSAEATGQETWPSLQGPHNLQNAIVACSAAHSLGINEQQLRKALASFRGLPHRMERVAEQNGVLFVNDSKATNPASTGPALGAYPKIHWIVGGLPKSEDLDECAEFFGNIVKAYTIGEAGPMFGKLLEPHMPVEPCEMMLTAVQRAAGNAQPGEVVLLSPACASFDQFKDFEARGACFKSAVNSVIEKKQVGTAAGGTLS
ncbi:UDP-N-acetylmuramoyl-L-alanine--D-glutamate ligase [Parasphingorhabdus halotolerans]|uniref:UDP-N-acetylmuramoylalanine--D-glutamate ligase n=1 Tax=Parasphingorhabdus halotolerans TaxID=2725558 RepID=A0A6H2DKZ8_9SPHN|nr:UDP-N-acetylmuramoyl-L-alanine--D-glutamate ligase [Parasphingorhabdus halotolerans]QJB69024.1 UDP-N-acetylmuramoyl-L-alanine--D-glutamate ligase [Parasphingorhabdus halotolerans]